MSLLPATGLETHDSGTTNKSAIINANWRQLEAIFAADTSAGTDAYKAIFIALIKAGYETLVAEDTLVFRGGKMAPVAGLATLSFSSTTNIDLAGARHQAVALTGNVTFTTSNRAAGRATLLLISADGTTRNLTWPAGWKWSGDMPATVPANESIMVLIAAAGTADSNIFAGVPGGGGGGGGGTIWVFKGAWTDATAYAENDVATNGGSTYLATSAHTSASLTEPGVGADWATVWALIAQKGADGSDGDDGDTGPAGADGGSSIGLTLALSRGFFRL